MDGKAVLLFDHGARDARWRDPFDRLALFWRAQHPNKPVALAFLEFMQPCLEEAIASHVAAGAAEIVVVPVFLAKEVICVMTSQYCFPFVGRNFPA